MSIIGLHGEILNDEIIVRWFHKGLEAGDKTTSDRQTSDYWRTILSGSGAPACTVQNSAWMAGFHKAQGDIKDAGICLRNARSYLRHGNIHLCQKRKTKKVRRISVPEDVSVDVEFRDID
jgi:hypothetical protein